MKMLRVRFKRNNKSWENQLHWSCSMRRTTRVKKTNQLPRSSLKSLYSFHKLQAKWKWFSLSISSKVFSMACQYSDVAAEIKVSVLKSLSKWWSRANLFWTKRWICKSLSSVNAYIQQRYLPCSKASKLSSSIKWASLSYRSLQKVITLLVAVTMNLTRLHNQSQIKI